MQLAKIDGGRLVLVPATMQHVKGFPSNTMWWILFGVGRGGKSSLCNWILGRKDFSVSAKSQPHTMGIWISEPVLQPNGNYLVVVDSEGTETGDTSQQPKILALVCLLACGGGVLVQNELHYTNSGLSTLAVLASTMQLIRGLDTASWPYLCFLLRNWQLEMTVNGRDANTEEFLQHLLDDAGDSHDSDRKLIRESFRLRMLHTLPYPYPEEMNSEQLPEGRFKGAFEALRSRVMSVIQVKQVGGAPCSGDMLAMFLEQCVTKINEDGNITIPSVVEATMDAICARYAEECFAEYKKEMAKTTQNLTGNDAPLTAKHEEVLATVTEEYGDRTEGLYQRSVDRFSEVLVNGIQTEFRITLADNAVVMERKTKELEVETIKRQSVVRVEIEHRDIDVGEPFKTETRKEDRWNTRKFRFVDTVWWSLKQTVHHQQRNKLVKGDESVEYSEWTTSSTSERVIDSGMRHE